MAWKEKYYLERDVYRNAEIDSPFEELYLDVREKENRLLDDSEVLQLPELPLEHVHHAEWRKRADTLKRFGKYLKQHRFATSLEIGCGNGWFSNYLADYTQKCIGQDINLKELQQAARVFSRPNLDFVCSENILELASLVAPDLIVFNASLQYFNPEQGLLQSLTEVLNKDGEIHILDSPVYASENEAQSAQSRSHKYYEDQHVPALAGFYFHYTQEQVQGEWLYRPPGRIKRLLKPDSSPFPWLRLTSKGSNHA